MANTALIAAIGGYLKGTVEARQEQEEERRWNEQQALQVRQQALQEEDMELRRYQAQQAADIADAQLDYQAMGIVATYEDLRQRLLERGYDQWEVEAALAQTQAKEEYARAQRDYESGVAGLSDVFEKQIDMVFAANRDKMQYASEEKRAQLAAENVILESVLNIARDITNIAEARGEFAVAKNIGALMASASLKIENGDLAGAEADLQAVQQGSNAYAKDAPQVADYFKTIQAVLPAARGFLPKATGQVTPEAVAPALTERSVRESVYYKLPKAQQEGYKQRVPIGPSGRAGDVRQSAKELLYQGLSSGVIKPGDPEAEQLRALAEGKSLPTIGPMAQPAAAAPSPNIITPQLEALSAQWQSLYGQLPAKPEFTSPQGTPFESYWQGSTGYPEYERLGGLQQQLMGGLGSRRFGGGYGSPRPPIRRRYNG